MSLSVVYVAETGHVVGALALTGATAPTKVESVVGTRLPLRISLGEGKIAELPLRANQLGVGVVDDEAAVFDEPLAFGVELNTEDPPEPKPNLVRLAPGAEVALTASKITVSLDGQVTRTTRVLVLISDGQDTTLHAEDILAGTDKAEFSATLKSKEKLGVLLLVAGRTGKLGTETVA